MLDGNRDFCPSSVHIDQLATLERPGALQLAAELGSNGRLDSADRLRNLPELPRQHGAAAEDARGSIESVLERDLPEHPDASEPLQLLLPDFFAVNEHNDAGHFFKQCPGGVGAQPDAHLNVKPADQQRVQHLKLGPCRVQYAKQLVLLRFTELDLKPALVALRICAAAAAEL